MSSEYIPFFFGGMTKI